LEKFILRSLKSADFTVPLCHMFKRAIQCKCCVITVAYDGTDSAPGASETKFILQAVLDTSLPGH